MDILKINLGDFIGYKISSDFWVLVLAVLVVILIIVIIVNSAKMSRLKKSYNKFMSGKDTKSLEETLSDKFLEVDEALEITKNNEKKVNEIADKMHKTFQKSGIVKYDAFNESGGKLSFAFALLNQLNDGVLINAMHTREGCYTYIKEIVDGNSYLILSKEEEKALAIAKGEIEKSTDSEEE